VPCCPACLAGLAGQPQPPPGEKAGLPEQDRLTLNHHRLKELS